MTAPPRRPRRRFVLLPVLLAAAVACSEVDVPTATARIEPFVHRVRAEGTLEAVESTRISVPIQVSRRARIAWLEEDGASVTTGDVVLRFDPSEMEIDLENAQGELAKSRHQERKTEATTEAQSQELSKDARLADLELEVADRFRPSDDELYSRNEILESQIDGDLARTRKQHTESVGTIRADLSAADAELIDIAEQLARQRLDDAQTGLSALEVKAPHDGLLIWSRDWRGEILKIGAEVWRGRELGSLPRLDRMHAKVYVLEADAGGIEVGAEATLQIASKPEAPVPATVTAMGAVSQPRFRGSPVRYFEVTLEPEANHPEFMKPGQRVSALIDVQNRPSALVVPRQAVQYDEGRAFVFRRQGGSFEQTEVEVATQSLALSVIDAGLEAGDVVALEDPRRALDDNGDSEPTPQAPPAAATGAGAAG